MEVHTSTPVEADLADGISLAKRLANMSKDDMIAFADKSMGLTVDKSLDPQAIREKLLAIHESRRNNAKEENAQSLEMTMALDAKRKKAWDEYNSNDKRKKKPFDKYEPNPPVEVVFYHMQHPGADEEFATSVPYGFNGEVNKFGFKTGRCPKYHLFHGETYVLPYAIVEHLKSLTYVTHKAVIDPQTGMIGGQIPIVKPRFVIQPVLSRDQFVQLSQRKDMTNETQDIPDGERGQQ